MAFDLKTYQKLGWTNEKYATQEAHEAVRAVENMMLSYEKRIENLNLIHQQTLEKERKINSINSIVKLTGNEFDSFVNEVRTLDIKVDDLTWNAKVLDIKTRSTEVAKELNKQLESNKTVLDSIVILFNKIGVPSHISKFKSSRSSTKITVEAEWLTQLKGNVELNCNFVYSKIETAINQKNYERKQYFDKLKEEKVAAESKEVLLQQVRKDSIMIAHACLKYGGDPRVITSIKELDTYLISIGETPASVKLAIEEELKL